MKAVLFNSKIEAIFVSNIIYNGMKRIKLNMLVGCGDKDFKNQVAFSPLRSKSSKWLLD